MVIVVFAVLHIVALTPACQSQTQAALVKGHDGEGDAALPCENVVGFLLAWQAAVSYTSSVGVPTASKHILYSEIKIAGKIGEIARVPGNLSTPI